MPRPATTAAGTLGTDSRRYQFTNNVPIIDIGLRLVDVETMGLQSEPVEVKDWSKRRGTLARHGATNDEITFIRDRRAELNAMTSRQFIDFIEAKLTMHGVAKVVPDAGIIEAHCAAPDRAAACARGTRRNPGSDHDTGVGGRAAGED